MRLLMNAIRVSHLLRNRNFQRGHPLFQRGYSNETVQPPDSSLPSNSFPQPPYSDPVYGRLLGITKHTLKTDIINTFEGCSLALDDVKVDYNQIFNPVSVIIKFPSQDAYDRAFRKKGRMYGLERAQRSHWDVIEPYGGKTVLLIGIPRKAAVEDVERFLCGCEFEEPSIKLFFRPAFPDPIRIGLVRFTSQIQAMNAFITKNRSFCLDNQILMRVLQ